jgi:hypothetical protein
MKAGKIGVVLRFKNANKFTGMHVGFSKTQPATGIESLDGDQLHPAVES